MHKLFRWLVVPAVILAVLGSAACIRVGEPETRTFEKQYSVSGPVTLDIENGSGDVHITAVASEGRVHVRGEVRLYEYLLATGQRRRMEDILEKPPISQVGDVLRFTRPETRGSASARINYTIEVPAKTEVRLRNGSGDVVVKGVDGPVRADTGSGDMQISNVQQRVLLSAGSGDIVVRDIRSELVVTARSGSLELDTIGGDIRAETSSGDIRIDRPGRKVQVRAASGDVEIAGVSADLRVNTTSGDCQVTGDPAPASVWEIQTRSGGAALHVSSRASFQLTAESRSKIDSQVQMTVEEETRRSLRGRVGKGEARVHVETGSGRIRIR